ncbi:MAG TPA: hypothetical protein VF054_14320 [Micromonosporaceae bacterium]
MRQANHYVLDGVVAGTVDLTSITGRPAVHLHVDGDPVTEPAVAESALGVQVTGVLGGTSDRERRYVLVLLPRVNLTEGEADVRGLAVVALSPVTAGGPAVVQGPVERYHLHHVTGLASAVES